MAPTTGQTVWLDTNVVFRIPKISSNASVTKKDGFPVRADVLRRVAYFPTDLAGSPDDYPGLGGSGGLGSHITQLDQSTP